MKPIDSSAPGTRANWVRPALRKLPSAGAREGTREVMGDGAFSVS